MVDYLLTTDDKDVIDSYTTTFTNITEEYASQKKKRDCIDGFFKRRRSWYQECSY